jgi:hypothetical protein
MTAYNKFSFVGYQLRPVDPKDLPLATEWNQRDEDHANRVDPRFWIEQGPGQDAYVLADKNEPVFFLKLVSAGNPKGVIELHIQFSHGMTRKARLRRREALAEGLKWLEKMLVVAGAKEIYFRSRNSGLIMFATKRLGFTPDPAPADGETVLRKAIGMAVN